MTGRMHSSRLRPAWSQSLLRPREARNHTTVDLSVEAPGHDEVVKVMHGVGHDSAILDLLPRVGIAVLGGDHVSRRVGVRDERFHELVALVRIDDVLDAPRLGSVPTVASVPPA